MSTNKILFAATLAACAAVAHADVTVVTTTAGKASIIDVGGVSTNLIKGTRMRTNSVMGKHENSLIIDIDGKRFVDIDDRKKSAVITPLASISEQLQQIGVGTMKAKLAKTTQTRQVAGFSCTVYDVSVTLPFSAVGQPGQGMDLNLLLAGTVCLSTTAPGLADYQQFYRAAAESGFIFGDPRAARSGTGAAQAKAYAELTRQMAAAGMALETHITISATGDGPMAGMMAKLAASEITTQVTSIAVGELAADQFAVPAGYKVKTK